MAANNIRISQLAGNRSIKLNQNQIFLNLQIVDFYLSIGDLMLLYNEVVIKIIDRIKIIS